MADKRGVKRIHGLTRTLRFFEERNAVVTTTDDGKLSVEPDVGNDGMVFKLRHELPELKDLEQIQRRYQENVDEDRGAEGFVRCIHGVLGKCASCAGREPPRGKIEWLRPKPPQHELTHCGHGLIKDRCWVCRDTAP